MVWVAGAVAPVEGDIRHGKYHQQKEGTLYNTVVPKFVVRKVQPGGMGTCTTAHELAGGSEVNGGFLHGHLPPNSD